MPVVKAPYYVELILEQCQFQEHSVSRYRQNSNYLNRIIMLSRKNNYKILIVIAASLLVVSCKKDYSDPSRATEDKVLNSPNGLTGIGVGLQRIYSLGRASSLYNIVTANGFIAHELVLLNQGNLPEYQLSQGGAA